MEKTKKKLNRTSNTKSSHSQKKITRKKDCILGLIDKDGKGKTKNRTEFSNSLINDIECVIAGYKPNVIRNFCEDCPESLKNELKKQNAKIYRSVLYIKPKYEKQSILLGMYTSIKPEPYIMQSIKELPKTKFSKKWYIIGKLLGYRSTEIKGFYLRQLYIDKLYKDKDKKYKLRESEILEHMKTFKINMKEFNQYYKDVKLICDKWINDMLTKSLQFENMYQKVLKEVKLYKG